MTPHHLPVLLLTSLDLFTATDQPTAGTQYFSNPNGDTFFYRPLGLQGESVPPVSASYSEKQCTDQKEVAMVDIRLNNTRIYKSCWHDPTPPKGIIKYQSPPLATFPPRLLWSFKENTQTTPERNADIHRFQTPPWKHQKEPKEPREQKNIIVKYLWLLLLYDYSNCFLWRGCEVWKQA